MCSQNSLNTKNSATNFPPRNHRNTRQSNSPPFRRIAQITAGVAPIASYRPKKAPQHIPAPRGGKKPDRSYPLLSTDAAAAATATLSDRARARSRSVFRSGRRSTNRHPRREKRAGPNRSNLCASERARVRLWVFDAFAASPRL